MIDLPEPKVEVILIGGPAHGAIIQIRMQTKALRVQDVDGTPTIYTEGHQRQVIHDVATNTDVITFWDDALLAAYGGHPIMLSCAMCPRHAIARAKVNGQPMVVCGWHRDRIEGKTLEPSS